MLREFVLSLLAKRVEKTQINLILCSNVSQTVCLRDIFNLSVKFVFVLFFLLNR